MNHPAAQGYYQATANRTVQRRPLEGDCRADVAIIGAGYTGLSTALHLAEAGFKPLVVEAETLAFGASGRNGGQVSSGQRRPQDEIECHYGTDAAKALWTLAEEAKALVKSRIAQHGIDCGLKPKIVEAAHKPRLAGELARYPEFMARHYGYEHYRFVKGDAFKAELDSAEYESGLIDDDAAHLHPLNYALGLADAAEKAGARIVEQCRVEQLVPGRPNRLKTAMGDIIAGQVVIACNGYIDGLEPSIAARIMPLNNFIIATEPLGNLASEIIPGDAAIADTRHVINYFRLSADRRLLFGGGETYGFDFPKDIAGFVRPHMLKVFPRLADKRIDYAWGGTLAITRPRLPYFAKPGPDIWTACGYSGHGVSIASLAGQILAEAIRGQVSRFDVMARIEPKEFPGGTAFRLPLLWLAMLWFRLKDRL